MATLERELNALRSKALAKSSQKTRNSQWRCFQSFCNKFRLKSLPASANTVCLFITYLSRKMEYTSVVNYSSSLISFHHHNNCLPPDLKHFSIQEALVGVKRSRHELPGQRKPVHPNDLKKIFTSLVILPENVRQTFWTACLVAFFSLARNSNLFKSSNHSKKHLRVCDVRWYENHITLSLPVLKNNRFKDTRTEVVLN